MDDLRKGSPIMVTSVSKAIKDLKDTDAKILSDVNNRFEELDYRYHYNTREIARLNGEVQELHAKLDKLQQIMVSNSMTSTMLYGLYGVIILVLFIAVYLK